MGVGCAGSCVADGQDADRLGGADSMGAGCAGFLRWAWCADMGAS